MSSAALRDTPNINKTVGEITIFLSQVLNQHQRLESLKLTLVALVGV